VREIVNAEIGASCDINSRRYVMNQARSRELIVVLAASLSTLLAVGCTTEIASSDSAPVAEIDSEALIFATEDYAIRVVTLVEGLTYPYSMTFLPDGAMLLTELEGRMRIVRDGVLDPEPVSGVPEVYYVPGRGGLMDVILHPGFEENHWVYFTYDQAGDLGATPAVARGELNGNELTNVEDIFVADAWGREDGHLSSYIRFAPDGMLYFSTAEREEPLRAQNMSDHAGKLLRLNEDGSTPAGNPFVGQEGIRPEIFAYGHRDIHGMTVHPESGEVWTNEHGDEVNIARAGLNYGWPYVSVSSTQQTEPAPPGVELTPPYLSWNPGISVSGMTFYTGDVFPEWKGDLFISGLGGQQVQRISFPTDPPDTTAPASGETREPLFDIGTRVRDVREGPDGLFYFVTDESEGRLMRIERAE
jgi:glucose/arabinose dehydrogenase